MYLNAARGLSALFRVLLAGMANYESISAKGGVKDEGGDPFEDSTEERVSMLIFVRHSFPSDEPNCTPPRMKENQINETCV